MKKSASAGKKIWHFLWHDNSIWSWIANILIAFILIKFIVYPGLGYMLDTKYPVVAVVSGSMEHKVVKDGLGRYTLCGQTFKDSGFAQFDFFWETCGKWYVQNTNVTKEQFADFKFRNGFNTGDIMLLSGANEGTVRLGDVLVYQSSRPDPIIHRVVKIMQVNGKYTYQTKGDHNPGSNPDEVSIPHDRVIGKAVFRIPWLGYVKIGAVKFVQWVGLV